MKRNILHRSPWLVGLLLVATLGPATASSGPPKAHLNPVAEVRFLGAMRRGKQAYDRHDFAASEKEFRQALSLRPNSVEALNDLGEAQYRVGQFSEAEKSFQQTAEAPAPLNRARAAYQAGNSLYRQNKLPEAAAEYRQALHWNEHDEDARFNLQVVLDKLKAQQPKDKNQQPNKPKDKPDKSKSEQPKDKPDQAKSDAKDKPDSQGLANKPEPPAKPQPGPKGSKDDDTDRILQYYQNQERQTKRKPAAIADRPRPSEETW